MCSARTGTIARMVTCFVSPFLPSLVPKGQKALNQSIPCWLEFQATLAAHHRANPTPPPLPSPPALTFLLPPSIRCLSELDLVHVCILLPKMHASTDSPTKKETNERTNERKKEREMDGDR